MRVRSLGQEDPLQEGTATHSSIVPGELCRQRSLAGYSPQRRKKSDTTEATSHTHIHNQGLFKVTGLSHKFKSPVAHFYQIWTLFKETLYNPNIIQLAVCTHRHETHKHGGWLYYAILYKQFEHPWILVHIWGLGIILCNTREWQ